MNFHTRRKETTNENNVVDYAGLNLLKRNFELVAYLSKIIPHNCNVADLGSGTGEIPILLKIIRPDIRITGIDYSYEMLNIALTLQKRSKIRTGISWIHKDIEKLQYENFEYDFIYSIGVFHHLNKNAFFLQKLHKFSERKYGYIIIDLIRPRSKNEEITIISKYNYSNLSSTQKKLFTNSLHASFTIEEINLLCENAGISSRAKRVSQYPIYWQLVYRNKANYKKDLI